MRFFDLLFSRYSQPLLLLEQYIRTARFSEFIDEFFAVVNETQVWEFWLHKETAKSWEDFRLSVIPQDADEEKLFNTICDIENTFAKGVVTFGTV